MSAPRSSDYRSGTSVGANRSRIGRTRLAANNIGIPALVSKVLGHIQARTTERYAHLEADPIRAVADRTARKIAAAMKGGGTGNVVVISGAKS